MVQYICARHLDTGASEHTSASGVVQSILNCPETKGVVRTVEVDVYPPLSDSEQLQGLALCGEHVDKYEDQPRLLESAHHKAIMILAEFLWRLSSTPPPVRVCFVLHLYISSLRTVKTHSLVPYASMGKHIMSLL
jgi:hypothetical protein